MPSPHGYTNYARRAPADLTPEQRVALELDRSRGDAYAAEPGEGPGDGPGPDNSARHEGAEAPMYEAQEGDEMQEGMEGGMGEGGPEDDELAMLIAELMRRRQMQGMANGPGPMRGGA